MVSWLGDSSESALEKINRLWRSDLTAAEPDVLADDYVPPFAGTTNLGVPDPHAIIGGMDVSGEPGSGNHNHLAVVIGRAENLAATARRAGLDGRVHMSCIRNQRKLDHIMSNVRFGGRHSMALCMKINMDETINTFSSSKVVEAKYLDKEKIRREFNYVVYKKFKKPVQSFVLMNNYELHRVVYQCDADCKPLAKNAGLRHVDVNSIVDTNARFAHTLADAVALLNCRGFEPPGVIQSDLTGEINDDLSKSFGRRVGRKHPSMR